MDGNTHSSHGKLPPSVLEERTEEGHEVAGEPAAITTEDLYASDDPEDLFEQGECPWCEEGDFQNPKLHARQAHPEEYEAHVESED